MNEEKKGSTYFLEDFNKDVTSQQISFYEANNEGMLQNGTTLEEMLRVSIERLQDLNSRFGCRENSIAITKMQEAIMWLNERTRDREKRGVEGKLEV